MTTEALLEAAVAGDRRALARVLSWIELRAHGVGAWLSGRAVRRRSGPGAPHVIGVTGPPGAGKSTLVGRWVAALAHEGCRVAVLAVDPASPRTGGALLGDRVRLDDVATLPNVFVRSLSSRGHLGGLSLAVSDAVDVLDLVGFDVVLVETVGVGQSETAVMELADTAVVLVTPESGDAIQAAKAGVVEMADVVVVHKCDRPGAAAMARALRQALDLTPSPWSVPVVSVNSLDGDGLDGLRAVVAHHLGHQGGEGRPDWEARRAAARTHLFLDLVAERARLSAWEALSAEDRASLASGRCSAWELLGRTP